MGRPLHVLIALTKKVHTDRCSTPSIFRTHYILAYIVDAIYIRTFILWSWFSELSTRYCALLTSLWLVLLHSHSTFHDRLFYTIFLSSAILYIASLYNNTVRYQVFIVHIYTFLYLLLPTSCPPSSPTICRIWIDTTRRPS